MDVDASFVKLMIFREVFSGFVCSPFDLEHAQKVFLNAGAFTRFLLVRCMMVTYLVGSDQLVLTRYWYIFSILETPRSLEDDHDSETDNYCTTAVNAKIPMFLEMERSYRAGG